RSLLDLSPHEYVAACRRRRFFDRLRTGSTVTDATFDAGYGSVTRMYHAIRLPGMQPATYGRGGAGATIDWATVETPLGTVLVASTAKGLCFVEVGQDVPTLVDMLRREFPAAVVADRPSHRLRPMLDAVRAVAL